jgi:flagellar protein FlaJ
MEMDIIKKIIEPVSKVKLERNKKVLILTLLCSFVFISLGILIGDLGILANAILLSTFMVAVPQFMFIYERYRNLKYMEEKFPIFLRDMIETTRSGMPLHKAIISISNFDYGKLSKEVKKMSNQLSWGMPLEKVLDQFSERIKRSKRLYTSIKIIREAHLSGGDVISTLETVANNSNILEEAERERRSMLNQYVVLMYALSFIFIGIVVAINNMMIPIFEVSSGTIGGSGSTIGISNPCSSCIAFSCTVCGIFNGVSEYIFSIDPSTIGSYYVSLFFFMSIIQSTFSGLVAGQIGENSVTAGIKHSLVLASVTFGAFYLLVYFGILGV